MTKKILLGKVISAFGIKGEVKIISYCENPTDIENYKLFNQKGDALSLKISNKNKSVVGVNKNGGSILIAAIKGVTDRNAAEKLRGEEIFVDRKDLDETLEDEFYYADLIGLDVVDNDQKKIGKVINVYDFGAGGMLEIEFLKVDGKNKMGKIENFPFKTAIFPRVDVKLGIVEMSEPDFVEDK